MKKTMLLMIIIGLILTGCAGTVGQLNLLDQIHQGVNQGYEGSLNLGKDCMAYWRYVSGLVHGGAGTMLGQLPGDVTAGIAELDVKSGDYWKAYLGWKKFPGNEKVTFREYLDTIDIDPYDLGYFQGVQARLIIQTVLSVIR